MLEPSNQEVHVMIGRVRRSVVENNSRPGGAGGRHGSMPENEQHVYAPKDLTFKLKHGLEISPSNFERELRAVRISTVRTNAALAFSADGMSMKI